MCVQLIVIILLYIICSRKFRMKKKMYSYGSSHDINLGDIVYERVEMQKNI